MKALVTGGTGFVGRRLIARLRDAGTEVTALVRSATRARGLADRGVRLVIGDLDHHQALDQATAGQDVVYHVAALTGAPDRTALMHANRDGTAHLVAAAERAAVGRLVLVSSAAAGGPASPGRPKRDAADDRPVTDYGRSKLASEQVVRATALPWTIVRPPTVYGPGDLTNFLTLFRAAARWGVVPVFGDGSQELSLIHVDDLTAACAVAGVHDAAVGGTWYVNHPEVVSSRQFVIAIGQAVGRRVRVIPLPAGVTRTALRVTGAWAGLTGRPTILHPDKAHEFTQPAWTGDPAPFMAATGWTPMFNLADGLVDTATWYREEQRL
jgi:nucleoside-diphosphate-sugar epimerase